MAGGEHKGVVNYRDIYTPETYPDAEVETPLPPPPMPNAGEFGRNGKGKARGQNTPYVKTHEYIILQYNTRFPSREVHRVRKANSTDIEINLVFVNGPKMTWF